MIVLIPGAYAKDESLHTLQIFNSTQTPERLGDYRVVYPSAIVSTHGRRARRRLAVKNNPTMVMVTLPVFNLVANSIRFCGSETISIGIIYYFIIVYA